MNRKSQGFTLIELMIAVAIIGIIAAIAYPSYIDQVRKSHRVDAQGVLMSLSNTMERYYTQNNSYADASIGSGAGDIFPDEAPIDGATKYYELVITAQNATSYTLCADPQGSQTGDGGLQLTSTGVRTWFANDNCTGATSPW